MDFSNMTGPQLVAAYNEMVLTATDLKLDAKTVKRFPDATTGRRRCAQLHNLVQHHSGLAALEKPTAAPEKKEDEGIPDFLKRPPQSDEEVAALLVKQAQRGKKPKKELKVIEPFTPVPEKIRKAIKRDLSKDDEPLLEDRGGQMVPSFSKQELKTMSKAKKKASGNGRFADEDKITKLSKENNARKGTHSYNLFEKIKTGMTIADWKKLAKERAGNYLRWYISHGLVKVG